MHNFKHWAVSSLRVQKSGESLDLWDSHKGVKECSCGLGVALYASTLNRREVGTEASGIQVYP